MLSMLLNAVLFPPIPILSCDMGSPQLSLAPNVTADSVYGSGAAVLNAPRVNYLEGGCLDLENTLVYEVNFCDLLT